MALVEQEVIDTFDRIEVNEDSGVISLRKVRITRIDGVKVQRLIRGRTFLYPGDDVATLDVPVQFKDAVAQIAAVEHTPERILVQRNIKLTHTVEALERDEVRLAKLIAGGAPAEQIAAATTARDEQAAAKVIRQAAVDAAQAKA
jgi:hypothetical protein